MVLDAFRVNAGGGIINAELEEKCVHEFVPCARGIREFSTLRCELDWLVRGGFKKSFALQSRDGSAHRDMRESEPSREINDATRTARFDRILNGFAVILSAFGCVLQS